MAKRTVQQRGPSGGSTSGDAQPKPAESKKLTEAERKEIHAEAMRLAEEAWSAERDNIRNGRDCQRFYAGGDGQWDAKARESRINEGRPVLTVNRLPAFLRQMTGTLRKNPPALKYLPARGKATQETAEAYNGITRHIDQQSNGKDCRLIATENAAIAGQGYYRIVTEYSSDDAFEQDIRIRPIRDPFGALIDPFAILPDKSDAKYGFVDEWLSPADFEATYPGMTAADVPMPEPNAYPWRLGEKIRIAEFWRRKRVKKTIYLLPDGSTVDDEKLIPQDKQVIKTRPVDAWEVCYYIISGLDVLSGPHPWAGRYIPIVQVAGEEITIDGATIRKGMVHDARDPQRVYNYSRTASVEAVALQPKAPYTGTVEHFRGFESVWQTAGSKNHSYLPFNIDPKATTMRPERAQPPFASQGLDAQAMIASEDLKAVTGIHDASLGAKSNETSGVAIAQRQQEGDTTTYLYPDNLSRAMSYEGRILADLIPKVYDTTRQVRILKEDGGSDMIVVNAKVKTQDARGKDVPLYALDAGEYDVTVVTGPNFASRRAEARAHMVDLAKGVPLVGQVAADLIVENSDFPGADQMAKRIKKAMGIGEDGEPEEQAQQPPDPTVVADVVKTAAETDKIKAETTGKEIENVTAAAQLQAMGVQIAGMMQMLQQMMAGQGGQPPVASEMQGGPMPPDAPLPEMAPPPNGAASDIPMVEVDSLEGAPV